MGGLVEERVRQGSGARDMIGKAAIRVKSVVKEDGFPGVGLAAQRMLLLLRDSRILSISALR